MTYLRTKITLKTILLFVFLAFGTLSLQGCGWGWLGSDDQDRNKVRIQTDSGEEFFFNVELAETPWAQHHGLMDRTSLDEGAGMLFLFGSEGRRVFWMKDTFIPLDMIFIGKDGRIRHIHHNARPQDETRITSHKPAVAVLEINGGLSDRLGISEGDTVLHPAFRNILEE